MEQLRVAEKMIENFLQTENLVKLITLLIAVTTATILVLRYLLAKRRWRLDLYDKRYPVFLATMQYLSSIVQNASVSNDDLMKFLRNSKDKEFLFGKDVQEYLEELYKKGVRLNYLVKKLEPEPVGEKRRKLVDEEMDLVEWFSKQFKESEKHFGRYLKIEKR
jgi:hypothetical protein